MPLASWGLGRIAAIIIAYWIAIIGLGIELLRRNTEVAAAAYRAAHPEQRDYLIAVGTGWTAPAVALALLGPPLVLVSWWAWVRRE